MKKPFIVWFSRPGENYFGGQIRTITTGNTEKAVDIIREITGAEDFRVEMKYPYSDNYAACTKEAQDDLSHGHFPELKVQGEIPADAQAVIVCYPIYWGTMPMALRGFLQRQNLSGKEILPLSTHEGSGLGHSESDLASLCPGAQILPGLAVWGDQVDGARDTILAWLNKNLAD